MKYTDEEALKEILKRSGKVLKKRHERSLRILSGTSACLFTALIAAISLMPGELSGAYSQRSIYGAFLLTPQAGGYVLAAVIAFVIGVVFTLLCQRYRKKSSPGIRALSGLEKRGHFSDRILFSVTGGTMEEGSNEVRTQEGTCPYCRKNTRYKVTVTRYTENGPREDTYYECVRCGREERPVI